MRALLIFGFLLAGALPVAAATYPERPIRIIVPVPPGGSSDFTARIVGQKLVEALGQNVVIENRGGASGVIASEMVARANADGYTLLMSSSSTHGIGPVLYRKLPYDAIRSFTHVALINTIPTAMVVHQSVPANSIREFVALAKARPDAYSFGSSGGGSASRLMGELFKLETGAPLTHVPYKGSGLATLDLIAGQVQVMFDGLPSHIANIKSGKLRAIAVLGERRSAALPNVPTAAEMGYPRIEGSLWYGVSGPAGLPREIVEKLRKEIFRIDALDEIRERFAGAGAFPSPLGPGEYTKFIAAENAKWAPVVAASGATAE
ncbi:MAG: tripartite tricarboxylate transporter substrate binding protein [Betaproteobacteria bacterium]|nr:tripartite tricarboxylate transporter substrate binding protein [Betaproteobacteria bacterium]